MYAIIENGVVMNVVVWDGNTDEWQPPTGSTVIEVTQQTGVAYVGFPYAGGRFAAPPLPTTSN